MENLFRLEKDLKVIARCLDGDEALRALRRHKPDILVLDIQMPAKDGLELLREMRKEQLPTRVVVLTATLNEEGLTEGSVSASAASCSRSWRRSFSCSASGKCTWAKSGSNESHRSEPYKN
jgi:DNA-binding NarL/FixJ family response regulator